MKKKLAFFVFWAVVAVCSILALNALLMPLECEDITIIQKKSVDNNYVAEIYDRSCNATVPFSRQVRVQKTKNTSFLKIFLKTNLKGIYSELYGSENIIYSVKGKPDIKLNWQKDNTIILSLIDEDEIYIRKNNWENLKIIYEN